MARQTRPRQGHTRAGLPQLLRDQGQEDGRVVRRRRRARVLGAVENPARSRRRRRGAHGDGGQGSQFSAAPAHNRRRDTARHRLSQRAQGSHTAGGVIRGGVLPVRDLAAGRERGRPLRVAETDDAPRNPPIAGVRFHHQTTPCTTRPRCTTMYHDVPRCTTLNTFFQC